MSKILVTGGLGFIGTHLIDELAYRGNDITSIDNMLNPCGYNPPGKSIMGNLADLETAKKNIKNFDVVFHLAANFSVPISTDKPFFDFNNTFLTTLNTLEAMRLNDIPKIVFTSSSVVYGEQKTFPIKENADLKPVSNYGAAKVASEAYIHSYCKLYGIEGLILRLANILGPRSNHGIVPDFVKKLNEDSSKLLILGDGKQRKSYLHISDCISAMLLTAEKFKGFDIYNIGSEEWMFVSKITEIICSEMHVSPKLEYTGGRIGWKGDVPEFLLDIEKLKGLGWAPKHTTEQAIQETVRWLK
jgi:UDP-glucose 4-epimerase